MSHGYIFFSFFLPLSKNTKIQINDDKNKKGFEYLNVMYLNNNVFDFRNLMVYITIYCSSNFRSLKKR